MIDFLPLQRMQQRIALDKADSTSSHFMSLMYGGELVLKLVTSAAVAAIDDDTDRLRYGMEYRLVRATGLGVWQEVLQESLTGPASAILDAGASELRGTLTASTSANSWQFEATASLRQVLQALSLEDERQTKQSQLLQWFRDFRILRNGTRGHGAPSQTKLDACCELLEQSLALVTENIPLFQMPWAYLRRNLSGKYRICRFGGQDAP